jgi:hypothetical protein
MGSTLKTYASKTIGAVAALAAVPVALASGAMPVPQQNALVQKYCAVCHSDAHMNGGLSLQHFDAAYPDPGGERRRARPVPIEAHVSCRY